ncbi:MAG: cysteine desulfurase [Eggerthellaceae bacterium]|nr:cysteine desulfurase [Eggerthellaceae bacterium]
MPVQVASDYAYFDYAATAPLCEEAALAMSYFMTAGPRNMGQSANANSLHSAGRAAFETLEQARRSVSRDLGAKRPDEIIFTSGATEANNAALIGIAHAEARRRRLRFSEGSAVSSDEVPHVIVSAIEHDAILAPAKRLEAQGFRVTRLRPNRAGFIEPHVLAEALAENTVLVSIQMANSEVGSVQPIAELSCIAHKAGALFHTDAVQALGKVPINLADLGVDAASFSAHKIGGPKGVGALYLRSRTPFEAYMLGGGQEAGKRSGTQNVCGIAGFAAACRAVTDADYFNEETMRLRSLRDRLYEGLTKLDAVSSTVELGKEPDCYLPNIVHVLVRGMESETLIIRLDAQGFAVSGGSACASSSLDPSHVLTAMGVQRDAALGALRISMGRYTTEGEVERFLQAMEACLHW